MSDNQKSTLINPETAENNVTATENDTIAGVNNTNRFKTWARVYRNTVVVQTILAAVLFIHAFILRFDTQTWYLESKSIYRILGIAMLCVASAWILSSFFVLKKAALPKKLSVEGNAPFFASNFLGFMSVFEAGYRLLAIIKNKTFLDCFDKTAYNYNELRIDRIAGVIDIITILICVASAVAFFLSASEKRRDGKAVLFGLAPVLRGIVGILQVYFNVNIGMNTPTKILTELGLMAALLAYLAEDRMRVSDEYARPNLYIAGQLLSVLVAGTAGISMVFFYFYYNKEIANSVCVEGYGEICLEGAFCLLSAVYATIRVSAYIRSIGKPVSEEPAVESAEEPADEASEDPAENSAEDIAEKPAEEPAENDSKQDETAGTDIAKGEDDNEG